jgi:hypothetical protein
VRSLGISALQGGEVQLPVSWERWLIALVIGLVWGNAFEYAYHRWMLHRRRSSFAKGHLEHHGTIGAPEEAEHVTLGRAPFHIAPLFARNAAGARSYAGYLRGLDGLSDRGRGNPLAHSQEGWLPPGLGFARAYHMSHHDIPNTRYNVF